MDWLRIAIYFLINIPFGFYIYWLMNGKGSLRHKETWVRLRSFALVLILASLIGFWTNPPREASVKALISLVIAIAIYYFTRPPSKREKKPEEAKAEKREYEGILSNPIPTPI